jgi:uncharacterized protein DUF6879
MTTPADLYRTCRVSARRLETLQDYDVSGDEERLRAFLAGEPLPPPRQGKADDLALIADLRKRGRYVGRVHVVDRPLTDYVRYELAVYAENVAAGEDVLIADRSAHPELDGLAQDFAIFDSETVVLFDYDDGRVRGYRVASDRETVKRCVAEYDLAAGKSVPLAEFMAATAAR